MNRKVKLYNVIFPIWLIWIIPLTWIVVLPANFLIDYLVVTLTMKYLQIPEKKEKAKAVIWRVWIMGFVADFIGTAGMYLANVIEFDYNSFMWDWWYEKVSSAVSYDPFSSIYAILWITVCVIITAFCIYFFNEKWCLRKAELEDAERKKTALSLAVFTAPYLFYLPTKWFI